MNAVEANELTPKSSYIDQIMSDMKNGVMALDRTGTILYANPQMDAFFERGELSGQRVRDLMLGENGGVNDPFWDTLMDVIQGHAIHYQKRVTYTAPSGRRYRFHIISSYLSGQEEGVVITVADETEYETMVKKRHDATVVLVSLLLLVCITVVLTELHVFFALPFNISWISRATELVAFFFLLIFLRFTSLTVRDFGLVPPNPRRELVESVAVLGVMVGAMTLGKVALLELGVDIFPANRPFWDFSAVPTLYYFQYIAIAFFQEMLTKSGMQKSLTGVFDFKHADLVAVLVTSVMFMALHVQFGLVFMLGAGALNAVLAVLYSRHNSLLGCCIVHYGFGILGIVLGWIV